MKKLLLTFALPIFLLQVLHAQQGSGSTFRYTAWKGTFNVPDPIECLMQFKKDTALLLYAGSTPIDIRGGGTLVTGKDSAALEVMTYKEHGDTVTLYKVSGGSPCGDDPGVYLAQRSNGKMRLVPLNDACDARKSSMPEAMTQVK